MTTENTKIEASVSTGKEELICSLISQRIRSESEYQSLLDGVRQQKKVSSPLPLLVTGLCEGATAALYAALAKDMKATYGKGILIVVADEKAARQLQGVLQSQALRVLFCPARDLMFHNITASHDYEYERLTVMQAALDGRYDVAIATPDALMQFTVPPKQLRHFSHLLCCGEDYPTDELLRRLDSAGYLRTEMVDAPGQYACRGGIVDLFPPASEYPLRLEFFGDTLDTMDYFDPLSQRRFEPVDDIEITPSREIPVDEKGRAAIIEAVKKQRSKVADAVADTLDGELQTLTDGGEIPFADKYIRLLFAESASLLDYFADAALFVLQDKNALAERAKAYAWRQRQTLTELLEDGLISSEYASYNLWEEEFFVQAERHVQVRTETFAASLTGTRLGGLFTFRSKQTVSYADHRELLLEDLGHYLRNRFRTVLLCETDVMVKSVQAMLQDEEIPCRIACDRSDADADVPILLSGAEFPGFELTDSRFALLSLYAGTGSYAVSHRGVRHRASKKSAKEKILSYTDLREGDYVVHASHGIGQYLGLQRLVVDGVAKDYVKIKYAGKDMLYLPCNQLDMISKYIGAHGDDGQLKLSKMGGTEWAKTKLRAKTSAKNMAKELIALYAERLRRAGFAFDTDTEMQREFESAFPYEETDGQLLAADEIKHDMESTVPMDRLLCGDVGFGKTEVALRAAFKAVCSGKQVAILVPTTILALQHFQTILTRMRGFPIHADMLSRFRTPKQQKETIRRLTRGEIDILVGTHRLLSNDVVFRDLGLVIVDEEQRFGVAHKEKLKQLSKNVDVLTLTATPIPRTLNMAMSGIRDMSVLEEAPGDRFPVQSYVLEYDDIVIADAIRRELRRGGQVFYLYNRVETIYDAAAHIRALVPDARILVAHGKTDKEELSDIWRSMVNGEADILISTTIIETGVNIPNANTLIIERADCLGLAQLHQIRGRVGRSNRRAYAYFTYPRGFSLSEEATKRLMAIREYTEFGAGFKVALRDLEIRGAGNLLGSEQHGHIDAVGYDLYMKLLNEAVLEEKGEITAAQTECSVDIKVDAYIPDKLIHDAGLRIEAYKKIAAVRTEQDSKDVGEELLDRYGKLPPAVENLLSVSLIRAMGEKYGITRIEQKPNGLIFRSDSLHPEIWTAMAPDFRGRLLINAGNAPSVTIKPAPSDKILPLLSSVLEKYGRIAREIQKSEN